MQLLNYFQCAFAGYLSTEYLTSLKVEFLFGFGFDLVVAGAVANLFRLLESK